MNVIFIKIISNMFYMQIEPFRMLLLQTKIQKLKSLSLCSMNSTENSSQFTKVLWWVGGHHQCLVSQCFISFYTCTVGPLWTKFDINLQEFMTVSNSRRQWIVPIIIFLVLTCCLVFQHTCGGLAVKQDKDQP